MRRMPACMENLLRKDKSLAQIRYPEGLVKLGDAPIKVASLVS